jgi:hypothetical protein
MEMKYTLVAESEADLKTKNISNLLLGKVRKICRRRCEITKITVLKFEI